MKNLIVCLVFVSLSVTTLVAEQATFRYHLVSEPSHLDPAKLSTSQSNYFYSGIFEGLYVYDDKLGLIRRGAKECLWTNPKKLVCNLDSNKKWSDGSPILAKHYVNAFQYLVDPKSYARRVDLLFALKNARSIYSKKMEPKKLGISAPRDFQLVFDFEESDSDFLYKLSSPVLVPFKTLPTKKNWKTSLFNGPYKITAWSFQKIKLTPNPFYSDANLRPPVEVYFIEDDSVALQLYQNKTLSFLRRIPATEIPFYKNKKDFIQLPVARFDYLGFNGPLIQHPELRKAMTMALDYAEFKQLFHALGRAGCPALPESYFTSTPCYSFEPVKAKALLKKVDPEFLKKRIPLYFSTAGGEDIRRAVEWFQYQWKKHLGLKIEAIPLEHKMYLSKLKKGIEGVYRKGIPLDRPSCLAAMENFKTAAPENYLKISSAGLDKAITSLKKNLGEKETKQLCTKAVKSLLDEHRYIPLGRIHFSLLASPRFTGWRLNELNQMDLTKLRAVPGN